jgi:hypothetical protein
LRAATGSSRPGWLTPTPMRADSLRTGQAEPLDYAIPYGRTSLMQHRAPHARPVSIKPLSEPMRY